MISRLYDVALDAGRGSMPLAFLRSVAEVESGMDPLARNPRSTAKGLLQVTDAVLSDWNASHPEKQAKLPGDMTDPLACSTVAGWHLNRICRYWHQKHPSSWPSTLDPLDLERLGLLAMAYHAGWSDEGGVGRILVGLEQEGQPISVRDALLWADRNPTLARYVSDPAYGTASYVSRVLRAYAAETDPLEVASAGTSTKGMSTLEVLLVLGAGIGGMWLLRKAFEKVLS